MGGKDRFQLLKSLETSASVLWQQLNGYVNISPKKNWDKQAGVLMVTDVRAGTFLLPWKGNSKCFKIQNVPLKKQVMSFLKMCGWEGCCL